MVATVQDLHHARTWLENNVPRGGSYLGTIAYLRGAEAGLAGRNGGTPVNPEIASRVVADLAAVVCEDEDDAGRMAAGFLAGRGWA